MKKVLILLAIFLTGGLKLKADNSDSLGLPGDNLDLYAVLDLFKQSTSLEDFEKKLNDPSNEINNLDLNNDQNVDYIRVVDHADGDAHAIALQVPVNATESQDVAVIELEKTGTDAADLQIVGDEELYGENYIVEASGDENTSTDQKWQGFRPVHVIVNVFVWSCVRFIYAPAYVVWVSPYYWMYYPNYWRPWHPMRWYGYHEHVIHYHAHYVCVHEHRMERAHSYYGPRRVASPGVHERYAENHQRHAEQVQRNSNHGGTANKTATQAPRDHATGQANGKANKPRQGGTAGPRAGQQKAGQQKASPRAGQQRAPRAGGGGQHKGGRR